MKKSAPTDPNTAWLEQFMLGTSAAPKTPAFRPALSTSERKADQTSRASREVTEAAANQRQAAAAKLKAARLAKAAEADVTRASSKTTKDG